MESEQDGPEERIFRDGFDVLVRDDSPGHLVRIETFSRGTVLSPEREHVVIVVEIDVHVSSKEQVQAGDLPTARSMPFSSCVSIDIDTGEDDASDFGVHTFTAFAW